jgi:tetratricopeptide (TPR) repeat protein
MAEDVKNSEEGPGKGKLFFDRAKTVAESGNFDYAIEMFVQGLNREPGEVAQHEALRRVALERKVKGGKPAGGLFGAKGPMKGRTPKDQMLNAAFFLAKDPGNISYMLSYMRAAFTGGYADVVLWFGPTLKMANKQKPKKDIYLELGDMYRGLGNFNAAADCISAAMEVDPNDMDLQQKLTALSAEATMTKGGFDKAENFRESLKDTDKTKELMQEDALSKSREYREKEVEKARLEYEAAPLDHRMIAKYAASLRAMEEEPAEAEAMKILQDAFEKTKTYQYRRSIDEIRIKQYRRQVLAMKDQVKATPEDLALKEKYNDLLAEQLDFELAALRDWTDHYPTDMQLMYELGIRLYLSKRFDEAITAFQAAQNNPSRRIDSLYYLGLSFDEQHMLPEASETLKIATDEYELSSTGNETAKRLWYALGRIYEKTGRLKEAVDIYSKITRWDIAYKDARVRLMDLRKKIQREGEGQPPAS